MKKLILSIMLVSALVSNAQTSNLQLIQNEHVLVYSLPSTALKVIVEYEKTEQNVGSLMQYSERYLATKQSVTENKTYFKLLSVKVVPTPTPDSNRTFSIQPNINSMLNNINLNAQGILRGVNLGTTETKNNRTEATTSTQAAISDPTSTLLPLSEEYMMAGSTAKMAEGAAKQIYRIRESRLTLLTGDMEHLPADGKSFETMLSGMQQLEKKLTELFVGSTNSTILTQEIQLLPQAAMVNNLLFRFSTFKGVVPANDLSGSPIFISVQPEIINQQPANTKSKAEPVGIYSILPANSTVSISDGVNTFFNAQFDMPQFGPLLSLPQSMFDIPKDKTQIQVSIDPNTGRLLNISKK